MSKPERARGDRETIKIGVTRRPLADVYHFLLTSPWWVLFAFILVAYLGANVCFAGLYLVDGGVENARPGSFRDAFFFSVQTMATIGYGKMVPVSTFANAVVTIEALFGAGDAGVRDAGLMFAKFSQPRARVIFSRKAVVSTRDGVRSLMVRLANERATGLVEAAAPPRARPRRADARGRGDPALLPRSRFSRPHSAGLLAVVDRRPPTIDDASPLSGLTSGAPCRKSNAAIVVASLVRHRGGVGADGPRPPHVAGRGHPLRASLPRHPRARPRRATRPRLLPALPRRREPRGAGQQTRSLVARRGGREGGSEEGSVREGQRVEVDEDEALLRPVRRSASWPIALTKSIDCGLTSAAVPSFSAIVCGEKPPRTENLQLRSRAVSVCTPCAIIGAVMAPHPLQVT